MKGAIRVLVVDDSLVARELIAYLLASDPELAVIATATDGEEALEAVQRKKPQVITMDIHMPGQDGFMVTRKIMEIQPTPIIIVTGSTVKDEVSTAFRALDAGAVAVLPKPMGMDHPDYTERARELIQTVKLMAEVKLVKRWPRREEAKPAPIAGAPPAKIEIMAIGASTGGPLALQSLLCVLPKDFPLPILIVQHIAEGFTEGFVEWLAQTAGFPVEVAQKDQAVRSGRAYVAPEGSHMTIKTGGIIALSSAAPENGLKPSISALFRSVADVYGPRAIGVLLTGMGKDGAQELKRMREKGAITFAQDQASAIVHGMPGEAINLGAASYVLAPDKIAEAVAHLMRKSE